MTQEELNLKKDRMRYTKDSFSSNMVLLGIVLNALYFVSIYQTDVGSYYYTWVIGASIIYNLIFMLAAFLASQGVSNRKSGYSGILALIGVMQIVRIFYLPAKAHAATVTIQAEEIPVMSDSQYLFVVICLAVSAVCCVVAAVSSFMKNRTLRAYLQTIDNQVA